MRVKKCVLYSIVLALFSFDGISVLAVPGANLHQLKKELAALEQQRVVLDQRIKSYTTQRNSLPRSQRPDLDARREQDRKELALTQLKIKRQKQFVIDAESEETENALKKSGKLHFDDCDLKMQNYLHSRIQKDSNKSDSINKIEALSRVQEMNSRALKTLSKDPNFSCQQFTTDMKKVPLKDVVRLRSALAIEQFAQGGSWLGKFFSHHSAASYEAKKCAQKIIRDYQNRSFLNLMIKTGDLAFAETGSELLQALSLSAGETDTDDELLADFDELMGVNSPVSAPNVRGLFGEMAPQGGLLSPGEVHQLKSGLRMSGQKAKSSSARFDEEFADLLAEAEREVEKEMTAQKDAVHRGCPMDGGSFGEVISGTFSPSGYTPRSPTVSQRNDSTKVRSLSNQDRAGRSPSTGQGTRGTRAR